MVVMLNFVLVPFLQNHQKLAIKIKLKGSNSAKHPTNLFE